MTGRMRDVTRSWHPRAGPAYEEPPASPAGISFLPTKVLKIPLYPRQNSPVQKSYRHPPFQYRDCRVPISQYALDSSKTMPIRRNAFFIFFSFTIGKCVRWRRSGESSPSRSCAALRSSSGSPDVPRCILKSPFGNIQIGKFR